VASPEPNSVSWSQSGKIRLLVVEDHSDTSRLLWLLLTGSSYVVKTAGNVAAALELAEQEPFDVLISDIGLPDGTGYELMKEIRERHSMKAIAVSGYGMAEDMRKSYEAGFSEHLVKPVEFSRLREAIERVLARA
jgi:two-component system CheB/CheR fusion protein